MRKPARRIASDEAHAWARNLRLNNPTAKLILCMVTLYVDAEGCCFVSIPTLADDCEMSTDTVRRRLAWLESIGVISRIPQWLDGRGRRNSTGDGKRTSDQIRLEISPSNQQGRPSLSSSSVPVAQPPDPDLALGQPSHCGEGLISEPELKLKIKKIEVTDEQALAAWDAWGVATNGKSFPRNKRGGWLFPALWPPSREASGKTG